MDITKFVLSGRDQALLYGDYSSYRASLSTKLLSARRRLGRVTKKGAKYTKKADITAEDIGNNNDFIHLVLLTSERAWAHAMSMKAAHTADSKGITGPTRSHIISRLRKASAHVDNLIIALSEQVTSGATEQDILEARAYATSLTGAEDFEKQSWEACVKVYSETWVIYSALNSTLKSELVSDLLAETVEQSIRYAAYQLRMPRTAAVPAIARKYFPRSDRQLVASIEKLDASVLRDPSKTKSEDVEMEEGSRTITWRSRTVELEDAIIAAALETIHTATKKLSQSLSSIPTTQPKDRAAAYDELLIASQDAVDATKDSIAELVTEGINQGDKRMQTLQVTRTAISYDTISWRIGRNRVLTGERDGALLDNSQIAKPKNSRKVKSAVVIREDGAGRQISRLREKVVMYDSTLQSLDTIKELPGVANDTEFLQEIEAKHLYFRALKCLAIARSHSVLSEHKNALALLVRASDLLSKALPILSKAAQSSADSPPSIDISANQAKSLSQLLTAETQRLRALVELSNLTSKNQAASGGDLPLVENLTTYPTKDVDLRNLVSYPPKIMPIPVKPLFFDVAWNYIEYPGRSPAAPADTPAPQPAPRPATVREQVSQPEPAKKKGWFGFGS